MNRPERHPDLTAFVLGGLDPEEAAETRRHLTSCPRCRNEFEGLRKVDRALQAARPLGVVRPFVLAGPHVRSLLGSRPGARGTGPFASRLATARTAVLAEPAPPLSERELDVLTLLPSLLSAGEIAAELTVSVNTVKTHIRSIYTKLGASSRREAVQHAQRRGLLP